MTNDHSKNDEALWMQVFGVLGFIYGVFLVGVIGVLLFA